MNSWRCVSCQQLRPIAPFQHVCAECSAADFSRTEQPRGTDAPRLPRTLASVCAHGGHWCPACDAWVVATDGPTGGLACAACGSERLEYLPPVEGFRESLEGAA